MKLFVTKVCEFGFAVCVADNKEEAIHKIVQEDPDNWNVSWLEKCLEEHPITAVIDRME